MHYCIAVKHGQPKLIISPHSQKGCIYPNDTANPRQTCETLITYTEMID